MNVLLTNDDGIEAPGMRCLFTTVKHALGDDVSITVVAPDRGRSECGHSVTQSRPLECIEVRPGWFSIDGTPVDCVRTALEVLAPSTQIVISGVNAGANLGADLLVSGTFAAAREGAMYGLPSMAISHYRRPDVPRTWDHVPKWCRETILEFVRQAPRKADALIWNVNLPAIDPQSSSPHRVKCDVDPSPIRREGNHRDNQITFEIDFHARPRKNGHDVDACFNGAITISEMTSPFHMRP